MKRIRRLGLLTTVLCLLIVMLTTDVLAGRIRARHRRSNSHSSSSMSDDRSIPAERLKSLKDITIGKGNAIVSLGTDTTFMLFDSQLHSDTEANQLYRCVGQLGLSLRDLQAVIQPIDPTSNASGTDSSDSKSKITIDDFCRSYAEREQLPLSEVRIGFSSSTIAPTLLEGLSGHELFLESGKSLKLVHSAEASDYVRQLATEVLSKRMGMVPSGQGDDEIEAVVEYANEVSECIRIQIMLNKAFQSMRASDTAKAIEQLNKINFAENRFGFIGNAQKLLGDRLRIICEITEKLDSQTETVNEIQEYIQTHSRISASWNALQIRVANEFARKGDFRNATSWTPSVTESKELESYRECAKEVVLQMLSGGAGASALRPNKIFEEDATEIEVGIELLNRLVIKNVTIAHEFCFVSALRKSEGPLEKAIDEK